MNRKARKCGNSKVSIARITRRKCRSENESRTTKKTKT